MENRKVPLFIVFTDEYSNELCYRDSDELLRCLHCIEQNCVNSGLLTQIFTSFILGRAYEKNTIAQRCSTNSNLDIDVRTHIEQDIQSVRDLNVRKALKRLRHQVQIICFGEIIVFGSHRKQFEEGGSYFDILRRFFFSSNSIEVFFMHLRIGKKYQDFVEFLMESLTLNPRDDKLDTFVIPSKAKNLMNKRMK